MLDCQIAKASALPPVNYCFFTREASDRRSRAERVCGHGRCSQLALSVRASVRASVRPGLVFDNGSAHFHNFFLNDR